MSLIELFWVTKTFGDVTALDHLSMSVEDGEYVCVLGPTGAGKTTLLRIIAGLLEPDEGEIRINGRLVNKVPPEERNAVYMFQQYALFPNMSVWQNVSFSLVMKDWDRKRISTAVSEVLHMVKLYERADALPHELSGGMQQRVALARGIASEARILLLDEPLGALDARLRLDLRGQLRKLAKDQKLTVIHVTHDQEEALMIADRIVVLRNGKIEQTGSPHEIYLRPQSIFVAGFVGGANFIEGEVAKVDDSASFINIREGQVHISDRSKKVGELVVVAVRPENISVRMEEAGDPNTYQGTIESATFIGGSMEYVIRLKNGLILSSKILLSNSLRIFDVGEPIFVSFRPEDCFIFPYPKTGLIKEIEAI